MAAMKWVLFLAVLVLVGCIGRNDDLIDESSSPAPTVCQEAESNLASMIQDIEQITPLPSPDAQQQLTLSSAMAEAAELVRENPECFTASERARYEAANPQD